MRPEPASHSTTERTLAGLPSGADVSVTVHRYRGGSGPTVYLQAAQHGIELNGPATLRRVGRRLAGATIAGTVVVVPVVNPLAFDHRSYVTPAEFDAANPNLNRVWPGDDDGTFQERLAASLWELVAASDAAVDLHTGTPDMLEHVRFRAGRERARTLVAAFGTDYILSDDGDEPAGDSFSGKFRTAAARTGVPAITAELANSRRVTRSATETGVRGIWNVLRMLGVVDEPARDPADRTVLRDDPEPTLATASGLFEPHPGVAVGERVAAGDELGTVYCPSSFEPVQAVTAADGGVVYSLTREAVVVEGERLAGVGRPI